MLADVGEEQSGWLGHALLVSGTVATAQGHYDRAESLLRQAMEHRRADSSGWDLVWCLYYLADLSFYRGDRTEAARLWEETLVRARAVGHQWGTARSLCQLAGVARERGEHDRALALGEESLQILSSHGDRRGVARAQLCLGLTHRALGSREEARNRMAQSRGIFEDLGDKEGVCYALEALARLEGDEGEWRSAASLLAAAHSLRAAVGTPLPPAFRQDVESCLESARTALGETSFAGAWKSGEASVSALARDK
jgi:tetratricopeptide (TPR) repeat protein